MIAWFMIALATLGLFSYVVVNGVQNATAAADANGRIETARRLDAAVSGLLARAGSPLGDNVMYLPVGVQGAAGQGYNLPADMSAMATTPFGQKIIYCPAGQSGSGSALAIQNPNGTSYSVATASVTANGTTKTYIVGGSRSIIPAAVAGDTNLLGFVMAPRSKLDSVASCLGISYNSTTGRFEAPGALVRPISRSGGIDESRTANSRRITFYVTPTGTGSGSNVADPGSLTTAMNFWSTHHPGVMTINLANGTYVTPDGLFYSDTVSENYGSLFLQAQTPGGVLVQENGSSPISLPANLVISGIQFNSTVRADILTGRTMQLRDSSMGQVIADGGIVSMFGTISLNLPNGSNSYAAYAANGGTLDIRGNITANVAGASGGFAALYGGALSIGGSTITVVFDGSPTALPALWCGGDGTCSVNNSTVNIPVPVNVAFQTNGNLHLESVALNAAGGTNIGLDITTGGSALVVNSQIGNSAQKFNSGVLFNADGFLLAGSNSHVWGNTCWSGSPFTYSTNAAGASSNVTDDESIPAISGTNSTAHDAAVTRNAQRAAYRIQNHGGMICNG